MTKQQIEDARRHAKAVVGRALARAQSVLGSGWYHVSHEVRWGLLCAELMSIIIMQDAVDNVNATPAAKASALMYAARLWEAATEHRKQWEESSSQKRGV
jgi:hypothetical protein